MSIMDLTSRNLIRVIRGANSWEAVIGPATEENKTLGQLAKRYYGIGARSILGAIEPGVDGVIVHIPAADYCRTEREAFSFYDDALGDVRRLWMDE